MKRVKAQAKWVRISPRKINRVAEIVRGMVALRALQTLKFLPQKGARVLEEVIKSAVANAKHNYKQNEENLVVGEVYVNKGTDLKRWKARARGRVNSILKRTSHLTVWLEAKEEA